MHTPRICCATRILPAVLVAFAALTSFAAGPSDANRLTYLDSDDPFHVSRTFPKLTTPQWVGEPGVEAIIILGVDDMTESAGYEHFLRPIIDRLRQIDGRAPVSIMTRSVPLDDPQLQSWLKEGLSIEVHTIGHPCPLLAGGSLESARTNFFGCLDLLNRIPGNHPVAFRMPCCDSMNSASPRFFAALFNQPSPANNFLSIDSSILNIITTNDTTLPHDLTTDAEGRGRFSKYLSDEVVTAPAHRSMNSFATTIEDYPYPFVIDRLCWEFPCMAPSDWEAQNLHGITNSATVADWEAALDATVLKQGVFDLVFHPHGWIRNDQIVELINYAATKYGRKVKFLNFHEANERLNRFLLADQPLRNPKTGDDNGVRILDLNHDGYQDVIIANEHMRKTRIWNPNTSAWTESDFPVALVRLDAQGHHHDVGVKFGIVASDGLPTALYRDESSQGAWHFNGKDWDKDTNFFNGLNFKGRPVLTLQNGHDRGVRLRDVERTGRCELLVGNDTQNAVFAWSDAEKTWKPLPYALPKDTAFVDSDGHDLGLRFVDINGDGYDDIIYSNEREYSAHLFLIHPKDWLGWKRGWSWQLVAGPRTNGAAIPMITRNSTNNGAWFRSGSLWVQNEDTAKLPDVVERRALSELLVGPEPAPKSPAESLASIQVPDGFTVELVASEPLIESPVSFDWGPDGRLWVVEMRDYPLGMDDHGKPGGVIRCLESTHNDGHYDKSTVFLEGLNFPNSIMAWGKGVLVCAAPDVIYAEDTDGDGKADVRKVLLTGFGEGNQQHRINGFDYGLDNRVYLANGGSNGRIKSLLTGQTVNIHGHDLSLLPDEGSMRPEPGQTQYGRHRDDWGNWFGCYNSQWGWHFYLPDHYLARNRWLAAPKIIRSIAEYPDNERVFAISQLQQRFNWPDQVRQVTSVNSIMPYRDDLFGPEFETSLFISEPANNAIHREVLEPEGVSFTSHRAHGEEQREFIASTDNWFRPTTIKTGPDGALYFADMYRLVIEHPEYFPDELKKRPDLRAGADRGRIYRVYPKGATLRLIPRLDKLDTTGLVAALDSPNGWQRDTVQRLLVQSHDRSAIQPLEALVKNCPRAKTRLQALCTLDGLAALSPETLSIPLADAEPAIRARAICLAEPLFSNSPELASAILAEVNDPDIRVRYQLAFSLGEWPKPEAGRALARLAMRNAAQPDMETAILSSSIAHLDTMLDAIFADAKSPAPDHLVEQLVSFAASENNQPALVRPLQAVAASSSGFSSQQISIAVGLLDGLARRQTSLKLFQSDASPALRPALDAFAAAIPGMIAIVGDSNVDQSRRELAARLLGRDVAPLDDELKQLRKLLEPQTPMPLQEAAIGVLKRLQQPEVADVLLSGWKGYAPGQRTQVLALLLSRLEWTRALLNALKDGTVSPAEIGAVERQKLRSNSDSGVRERAAGLFTAGNPDRAKVVKDYQLALSLNGDAARGAVLFRANCVPCHRLNGEGFSVGPDLATVTSKPASELLTSILDPSRAIEANYTAYTAVTRDGRELTGIIGDETPNSITLRMPGGIQETILRSDLTRLTASKLSLMPEGFEIALKPQDIADLIAFITSSPRAEK